MFADGITSTARRRIYPDLQRHYSGYVGWRGTVAETDLSAETVDLVKAFESYVVSDAGQTAAADAAKSAPLSKDLQDKALKSIESIKVKS